MKEGKSISQRGIIRGEDCLTMMRLKSKGNKLTIGTRNSGNKHARHTYQILYNSDQP